MGKPFSSASCKVCDTESKVKVPRFGVFSSSVDKVDDCNSFLFASSDNTWLTDKPLFWPS